MGLEIGPKCNALTLAGSRGWVKLPPAQFSWNISETVRDGRVRLGDFSWIWMGYKTAPEPEVYLYPFIQHGGRKYRKRLRKCRIFYRDHNHAVTYDLIAGQRWFLSKFWYFWGRRVQKCIELWPKINITWPIQYDGHLLAPNKVTSIAD